MNRRLPPALVVYLLALIGYAISAQGWARPVSIAPHYVYLAQALLNGHVDLIQLPPSTYDLLSFNGQWFVAGSPLPAILMLPLVALFGVSFSDVAFSVGLGAINVALVYDLLGLFRRPADATSEDVAPSAFAAVNGFSIDEPARRWLTLLFAVGTPFWYLAALGTYWFTAHVVAVLFALLAVREALTRRRWFLAGLWLACAGFARPTVLALAPFFLALILFTARQRAAHPPLTFHASLITRYSLLVTHYSLLVTRYSLQLLLALLIGLSAHAAYNLARFGSMTDFGYAYVSGADNLTSVYARYGGFNPRFAPCNLAVSLIAPPEVNGGVPDFITRACGYLLEGVNLSDTSAPIAPNPLGMSVFIATPALLLIVRSIRREPLLSAAWIGLLSTLIPLWLYHNTGSLQFGWRYLFDAAPLWIILLAYGARRITRLNRGLILASVAMNLWGFLWMFEKIAGRPWWG